MITFFLWNKGTCYKMLFVKKTKQNKIDPKRTQSNAILNKLNLHLLNQNIIEVIHEIERLKSYNEQFLIFGNLLIVCCLICRKMTWELFAWKEYFTNLALSFYYCTPLLYYLYCVTHVWQLKRKDQNQWSITREIVLFVRHPLHPCQNLKPTLHTMQLIHWQSCQSCGWDASSS